jgi:hypothetical protein
MCPDEGCESSRAVCGRVRDRSSVPKGVAGRDLLFLFFVLRVRPHLDLACSSGLASPPVGVPFPMRLKRKTFHANILVFTQAKKRDITEQ